MHIDPAATSRPRHMSLPAPHPAGVRKSHAKERPLGAVGRPIRPGAAFKLNIKKTCGNRQARPAGGEGRAGMVAVVVVALVVLGLAAALAASAAGNLLLYQQNAHLAASLDRMAEENERLGGVPSGPGAGPAGRPAGAVAAGGQPGPGAAPPEGAPEAGGGPAGGQSITAVAVRPLAVREGFFFERTQYEGTVMEILVSVREQGGGLVLVDTEVPTGVNFQGSARAAAKAAQGYLGADLSGRDVIFSITAPAGGEHLPTVDGDSAGAAMAVLLVSELQGRPVSGDVVITGSVLPDGSIGAVGGISEKAEAAGRHGAGVFLVPAGQGVTWVESCEESRTGNFIYRSCTLEEKPLSAITEERFGMGVLEVADIAGALRHFQDGG